MEAILAEYGHSAEEEPGLTMFNVSIVDMDDAMKIKVSTTQGG
jgi:hypothetical protein